MKDRASEFDHLSRDQLIALIEVQAFHLEELTTPPPRLDRLQLTPIRRRMLAKLADRRGEIVTHEQLMAALMATRPPGDGEPTSPNSISQHIYHIRKQTGLRITNIPKIGYRLEND